MTITVIEIPTETINAVFNLELAFPKTEIRSGKLLALTAEGYHKILFDLAPSQIGQIIDACIA